MNSLQNAKTKMQSVINYAIIALLIYWCSEYSKYTHVLRSLVQYRDLGIGKMHLKAWFLAARCNCIASSAISRHLSVVCLSACSRPWRECIVTKRLKLGSCSFHTQCLTSLPAKFDYDIRRGSPWLGTQTGVRWFLTSWCYISETVRDRAYVTVTNRKSCMGFDCNCNKPGWPWMTLNINSLLCHQSYTCFDRTAEARITRFSL